MSRAEMCPPSFLVLVGQKAYQLKSDNSVMVFAMKTLQKDLTLTEDLHSFT